MTASKINPITMSSLIDAGANRGVHIPLHFAKGMLVEKDKGFLTYTRYALHVDAVNYMRAEFGTSRLKALVVFFHKDQLAEVLLNPEPHQGLKRFLEGSKNFPGFVIVGNGLYINDAEARLSAFFTGPETFLDLAHLHNNEVDHKTRLNRKFLAGFQTIEDIDQLVNIFKVGQLDRENLREMVNSVQAEQQFDRHNLPKTSVEVEVVTHRDPPDFYGIFLDDDQKYRAFFRVLPDASLVQIHKVTQENLMRECMLQGSDMTVVHLDNRAMPFDKQVTIDDENQPEMIFIANKRSLNGLEKRLTCDFKRSLTIVAAGEAEYRFAVDNSGEEAAYTETDGKFGFPTFREVFLKSSEQAPFKLVNMVAHGGNYGKELMEIPMNQTALEKTFRSVPASAVLLGIRLDVKRITKFYGHWPVAPLSTTGMGDTPVTYILADRSNIQRAKEITNTILKEALVGHMSFVQEIPFEGHQPEDLLDTHETIVGFVVNQFNTSGFIHGGIKLNASAGRGPYAELTLFVERKPGKLSLKDSSATFAFESGKVAGPYKIDATHPCDTTDLDLETTLLTALGKLSEQGEVKVFVTASENFSDKPKPTDRPLGVLREFQGVWKTTNKRNYLEFKAPEQESE